MTTVLLFFLLLLMQYINAATAPCPYKTWGSTCGPCTGLSNDEKCIFDCTGYQQCFGDYILICNDGHPCEVICDGGNACHNVHVKANKATSLQMTCNSDTGTNSCINSVVNASQVSGSVDITCIESNGCYQMNLTCGYGDCLLDCDNEWGSCHYMDIDATLSSNYQCSGDCNDIDFVITASPTESPITLQPTKSPISPTISPSTLPPTNAPISPSVSPTTMEPTKAPISPTVSHITLQPTLSPIAPSVSPTKSPITNNPTNSPISPTRTPTTATPTAFPSNNPSLKTTNNPTISPSRSPTLITTLIPTSSPNRNPRAPTETLTAHQDKDTTVNPYGDNVVGETTKDGNQRNVNETANSESDAFALADWTYIVIGCVLLLCCLTVVVIVIKCRNRRNQQSKNGMKDHFDGEIKMKKEGGNFTVPYKTKMQSVSQVSPAVTPINLNEGNNTLEDFALFNDKKHNFEQDLANNVVATDVMMDSIIHHMSTANGDDVEIEMIHVNKQDVDDIMNNNDEEEEDADDQIIGDINDIITTPGNINDDDIDTNVDKEGEGTTDSDNINEFETPSGDDVYNDQNNVQLTLGNQNVLTEDEFIISDDDDNINNFETIQ